jgi:hypothetical protein
VSEDWRRRGGNLGGMEVNPRFPSPEKVSEDSREGERNLGDTEADPRFDGPPTSVVSGISSDFRLPRGRSTTEKLSSPSLERLARTDLSRILSWRTSLRIELRVG